LISLNTNDTHIKDPINLNEIIKCKNCGKPIDENRLLCYKCRSYLSRKFSYQKKIDLGSVFITIGGLALIPAIMILLLFNIFFLRTDLFGMIMYIIGVIVAIIVPVLMIYIGTKKKRKPRYPHYTQIQY
jgi:hypothetical protein